jgi:hypothetical protein
MRLIHISEALRMFRRSRNVKKFGFKKYSGTPDSIAQQIIDSCWNKDKQYFQVSSGHFCEFYSRDFGMCAEALVALGYRKKVIQTLDYALSGFEKHGRVTTSISPGGRCFDFPYYAADSLPFIFHAIRVSNAKGIMKKYGDFLRKEIDYYYDAVFDNAHCLVRQDKHFSSIKDYARRRSSCYSNCMLSMLKDDLSALGFYNPFSDYDIKKSILHYFWNGSYFYDDLAGRRIVTGDANTFPFWCGVVRSKHIFRICMESMQRARLVKPFPLKYSSSGRDIHKMHITDLFSGGYERDAVWPHLGLCFLDVVKMNDPVLFRGFMAQYASLMRKHKNFLEVYTPDGLPFMTTGYCCDESMLWVSKYLCLSRNLIKARF